MARQTTGGEKFQNIHEYSNFSQYLPSLLCHLVEKLIKYPSLHHRWSSVKRFIHANILQGFDFGGR